MAVMGPLFAAAVALAAGGGGEGPSGTDIREAMIRPLLPILGGSPEAVAEMRAEIGELTDVRCRKSIQGPFRCWWTGPRGEETARLVDEGGAWRLVGAGDD